MKKIKEFIIKNKVYFLYTLLFVITFVITYWVFYKNRISFIWNNDGVKQHFAILYDFNENIRNIFKEGLSTFSLNIGLGLDFIGQYSYYVLGDPFALISLLFPMDKLNYAYCLMIILRMFCAGLAFIVYCRFKKQKDIPTLIGTIAYVFCGFAIYAGLRHPYFLNSMILLPIIFIGIEKIFKEDKKALFIISIFLSAVVNYYFFYMLTIIAVIYAAVYYFYNYRKAGTKYFFKTLGKFAVCYIIGVLLSGIILIPTIYAFLNSARSDAEIVMEFSSSYYPNFLMNNLNINGANWKVVGLTSLFIPLLTVAFINIKNNKKEITMFLIMTIMLLIPQIASIMNGFSYPTDRWVFAYIFILCFIMVNNFKNNYDKKEIIIMAISTILYGVLAYVTAQKNKQNLDNLIINMSFAIVFVIIIAIKDILLKNKLKKVAFNFVNILVIVVLIANIKANSSYLLDKDKGKYSGEFIKLSKNYKIYENENGNISNFKEAIDYIKQIDHGVYRITKYPISIDNTSVIYNYNGISGYYSIGNSGVYHFAEELELTGYKQTVPITTLNNRSQLMDILDVKYLVCDEKYVPYGYEEIKEIGKTKIYENKNYLPIGIFYNNYISGQEYDGLTSLEKQNSMIEFAKIEDEEKIKDHQIEKGNLDDIKNIEDEINYTINDEKGILDGNTINTEKGKNTIELQLDYIPKGELYIIFENINYTPDSNKSSTKYTLKVENAEKTVSETVQDIKNAYYIKKDNLVFNFGESNSEDNKIEITIDTNKGKFTFDNIKVVSIPYDKIDEQTQKIRKSEFENVIYSNNKITGTIKNQGDGILQLAIPFSNGWKCYVDGQEVEIIKVNTAFVGIPLKSGEHSIEFVYSTPGLNLGIMSSILGIIGLIILVNIDKNNKRKKKLIEKKC